jgi:hypothetical protein
MMEKPKPAAEHKWLQRLVGEWTSEGTMLMGPDQPPMNSTGTYSVKALGDVWIVGEMTGEMPGSGESSTSIISLGYDPEKEKCVGTFISEMMSGMWVYEGVLKGDVMTLDTEGPSFTGEGRAKYQDIVEIKSDDEHTLSSQVQGDDGKWTPFMTMTFKRTK